MEKFQQDVLDAIEKDFSPFDASEDTLELAIFSSCMVTNLINDLLDLAKLETNTFSFSFDYFDLIDTINQALCQVKFLANQKGITLKSKIKNVFGMSSREEFISPIEQVHNDKVENIRGQLDPETRLLTMVYGDQRRYF